MGYTEKVLYGVILTVIMSIIPMMLHVNLMNRLKKTTNIIKKVLIIFIAFILVTVFFNQSLLLFLILFYPIEKIFDIISRKGMKIKTINKIVASSLIITGILSLLFYQSWDLIQYLVLEHSMKNSDLSNVDINSILSMMKDTSVVFIFIFVFLNEIYMNIKLFPEKSKNEEFKLSFYWIIIYITMFFVLRYLTLNIKIKVIVENILEIVKFIYMIYGIIVITKLLDKIFRQRFLSVVGGIVLGLSTMNFMFLFGVVATFYSGKYIEKK